MGWNGLGWMAKGWHLGHEARHDHGLVVAELEHVQERPDGPGAVDRQQQRHEGAGDERVAHVPARVLRQVPAAIPPQAMQCNAHDRKDRSVQHLPVQVLAQACGATHNKTHSRSATPRASSRGNQSCEELHVRHPGPNPADSIFGFGVPALALASPLERLSAFRLWLPARWPRSSND
jgi:hypothetical protein